MLTAITETIKVEAAVLLTSDVIDDAKNFNPQWIKNSTWITIPVESGSHFSQNDATKMSTALQKMGYQECFAVATEPLENFPTVFLVKTTTEDLLDFSEECSFFNFVLIPEDKSFAILCTVYDYFLVAGKEDFVEQILQKKPRDAWKDFGVFASVPLDERLLKVANRYRLV